MNRNKVNAKVYNWKAIGRQEIVSLQFCISDIKFILQLISTYGDHRDVIHPRLSNAFYIIGMYANTLYSVKLSLSGIDSFSDDA